MAFHVLEVSVKDLTDYGFSSLGELKGITKWVGYDRENDRPLTVWTVPIEETRETVRVLIDSFIDTSIFLN